MMKIYVKIAYILFFLLFTGLKITTAQNRNPEDITGKIEGRSQGNNGWQFEMINNLDGNSSKYYPAMKAALLKVLPVIIDASAVKPPKGFDVVPSLVAYQANTKMVSGNIDMTCYNYAKNLYGTKGLHKQSESHGSLHFSINDLQSIAPQGFKNECEDVGVPIFFIKPEMKKVNDNVLIIGNHTKIIKKRSRPIIVPLTKKEYLEFLVKRMSTSLQKGQEDLKELIEQDLPYKKQQLQKAKKEYSNLLNNKAARSSIQERVKFGTDSILIHILPKTIATMQQGIINEKKAFSKLQKRIAQYRMEMNNNPADPAYIKYDDIQEFPGGSDDNLYQPLTTSNDGDAKPLFKINQEYYDTSLSKTAIQVIVLDYHYSNFAPVFERNALSQWFREINVEALSKMIR